MSPNNGILFNGVLRPRLLNNPFASSYFVNLDFLLLHKSHFDDNIVLQFSVLNTFEFTFFVSFLHFKQYVNMFYNNGLLLLFVLKNWFLMITVKTPWLFFDFSLITLFVTVTFFLWTLSVKFLQLKQEVLPSCFNLFCTMFYNNGIFFDNEHYAFLSYWVILLKLLVLWVSLKSFLSKTF